MQLPKSTTAKAISEPVTVTVPISFRTNRMVRIGGEAIRLDVLDERVRQALAGQLQRNVILAGDGAITLQELITIADRLSQGGVTGIGIQVQPAPGRR